MTTEKWKPTNGLDDLTGGQLWCLVFNGFLNAVTPLQAEKIRVYLKERDEENKSEEQKND